jgi:hypothetical protein
MKESRRLTLDLVPSTCWFSNLRSELPKPDWDKLRRASYRKANYRCEICGGVGPKHPVECHEIWAYDEETGKQTLEGLQSICPACHGVKHFGFSQIRGNGDQAFEHYCSVNDVDRETAEKEINAEFDLWERRSQVEWDLDLSWLERQGVIPPKNHGEDDNARPH